MVRRERCHRSEDISISEQTAFVLRGGCLDKAVILEHIRVDTETGTKWLSLWKTDPILCSFLTNQHSGQRPLKHCLVLDTLKECREAERKRLQQEFFSAVGTSDEGQIVDKAASLGINAAKTTTARKGVHKRAVLPPFISLHITHGGRRDLAATGACGRPARCRGHGSDDGELPSALAIRPIRRSQWPSAVASGQAPSYSGRSANASPGATTSEVHAVGLRPQRLHLGAQGRN